MSGSLTVVLNQSTRMVREVTLPLVSLAWRAKVPLAETVRSNSWKVSLVRV